MAPKYRDAEWLERKYHAEGLTQRAIAEECDVHPSTVRKWMTRHGIETREPVGENHPLYGKERSEDVKERISEALEGREFSEETRRRMAEAQRGQSLPEETREKISKALMGREKSEETRRRMSRSTAGENNPRWKGGYSDDKWYGPGWTVARERVQERDEVCQECGRNASEMRLEVHHIVPVRLFEDHEELTIEDAHQLGNLVLLCASCHTRADYQQLGLTPTYEEIPDEIVEQVRELWKDHLDD